mgnify:CR=1 FL=1
MANVSSSNGLEKRPKLRFPGFDEPWKETALSSVLTERNEYAEKDGTYEHATLSKEGIYGKTARYDRDFLVSTENKKYKVTHLGDLCYNPANLKFGVICLNTYGDAIFSPIYVTFEIEASFDPDFIGAYLTRWDFINRALKYQQGTVYERMAVSPEDFVSIKCCFPQKAEQTRLAEFITLLDKRIAAQGKYVESLKKYKRGVMQHIFRQLPSRNGAEWTCVRLGDIFKKVSRRNTDGVIKNVITNSAEYGLIPQRDFFDKDIAVDGNTANYYVIENGDFVYNPRKSNSAPYGPFNRYTLSEQGIISPLYTCLVLQADISPSYLAWYFKSDAWYRYIYDNGSQGVRHDRVSMTDDLLMGIPVMYPSHVKQLLYADILDMVEARLQATQKTLDFLNKMRDGYMRQLFI